METLSRPKLGQKQTIRANLSVLALHDNSVLQKKDDEWARLSPFGTVALGKTVGFAMPNDIVWVTLDPDTGHTVVQGKLAKNWIAFKRLIRIQTRKHGTTDYFKPVRFKGFEKTLEWTGKVSKYVLASLVVTAPFAPAVQTAFSALAYLVRRKGAKMVTTQEAMDGTMRSLSQLGTTSGYPLPASTYRVSSPFGYRVHPISKVKKFHNGTDYAAVQGVPVMSFEDGVVTKSAFDDVNGNFLIIKHTNGMLSSYSHLQKPAIPLKGEHVVEGQHIGYVGTTGRSTGPHLHFMIYAMKDGKMQPIDADLYLRTRKLKSAGKRKVVQSSSFSAFGLLALFAVSQVGTEGFSR